MSRKFCSSLLLVVAAGLLFVCPSESPAQTLNSVALAWDASPGSGVAGYVVHYGSGSGAYSESQDVAAQTTATVGGLSAGQTYFFVVTAYDSNGVSSLPSNEVRYQVPADPVTNLPPSLLTPLIAPWQTRDVGDVRVSGTASNSASTYVVQGAGALGSTADAFQYVYQSLIGDGAITARVRSLGQTGPDARAGIMVRESLTTGSRHVFIGISSDGQFRLHRRTKTSGKSGASTHGVSLPPDAWVRLTRRGGSIEACTSVDGKAWLRAGSVRMPMAANIHIGLVVASGRSDIHNNATFSDVVVIP